MPLLLSRVKEKISMGGQLRREKKCDRKRNSLSAEGAGPFHWTLKPSFFFLFFYFLNEKNQSQLYLIESSSLFSALAGLY